MYLTDVFQKKNIERIPIWMMRQAGRHLPEYLELRKKKNNFLDLCYDPVMACEVTMQPIRRYDFDAAILFSDIMVVPDALGQKVTFINNKGPILEAIENNKDLLKLKPDIMLSRLQPVLDTVSLVREKLPPKTALIGFCGAPWTLASYMIEGRGTTDHIAARSWAYSDPDGFETLIRILSEASVKYLNAQVDAGADVLQIFDSWAGILPEDEWRKWCKKPLAWIADGVKNKHPNVPIIAFPRGSGPSYSSIAGHCRIDGISIDSSISLKFARQNLQKNMVVQGNLDPLVLAIGGKALDKSVENILNALGDGPFIFNLGHGVLPQTPVENVEHVVNMVRKWSV